jgi:alcohol dehydrogenase YqhD (iron-dependent ADH family)
MQEVQGGDYIRYEDYKTHLGILEAVIKQEREWHKKAYEENRLLKSRVEIINLFAKALNSIISLGHSMRDWGSIRIPLEREITGIYCVEPYDFYEPPRVITIAEIAKRYEEVEAQLEKYDR